MHQLAILIPEYLPDNASSAERKVFGALRTLPDDVWVYYEPVVKRRYPDFIVIVPSLGVFVIEVKGYPLPWIQSVDPHEIVYLQAGQEQRQAHPSRQAREYMHRFMMACEEHPDGAKLKTNGRLSFAMSHLSLMMGVKRDDLEESPWNVFFASNNVRTGDEFEREFNDADSILSVMRRAIDPEIPIQSLSDEKIETIRKILHEPGGIKIKKPAGSPDHKNSVMDKESRSVASIDRDQEAAARSIGDGHRIIYGVPGSGKTIILLYRAKIMADAGLSVLFVCYNVPFAQYVRKELASFKNVNVQTFGQWARDQGAPVNLNDREAYGSGLLEIIGAGRGDAGQYDCVLVDEGQDFAQSWFQCVVNALKEPVGGELMIAYDWSQNLYRADLPVWSKLGINARGRTKRLRKNYRNTKQIVSAAYTFCASETDNDDDRPHSVALHKDNCVRQGPWPVLKRQPSMDAQVAWVADAVRQLSAGSFNTSSGPYQASPQETLVLCRNKRTLNLLGAEFFKQRMDVPVSTIHGSKGLQARVVFIVGAEELNASEDRPLLYVGLTRPEDLLIVTWSHDTPMTKELEQNVASFNSVMANS